MMAYLEHYDEGSRRRGRLLRRGVLSLAALLVGAGVLFFAFHNIRQERQARRFFELLSARQYEAAYALWAPSESDRRGYPLQAFLDDWGPQSGRGDPRGYRIARSRSCGSGVILAVALGKSERERLWVERDSLVIGFPPPAETLPKACSF